jgi:uncharacterized protein (TIGR02466 family)
MSTLVNLFPIHLSIKNLKDENLLGSDFDAEIASILNNIAEDRKLETATGDYSTTIRSYDDIINIHSMSKFKSYMRNYMKTAWTDIGYEECSIAIERSWINRFEKGSRLMGHAHGSTEMVMTYYHQVPEGSAEISFFNPFDRQLGMAPFKNKLFTYAPKAGDLLAWPGFLWHEVHVQQIDQPRIAISMHVHQGSYALADRWVRID